MKVANPNHVGPMRAFGAPRRLLFRIRVYTTGFLGLLIATFLGSLPSALYAAPNPAPASHLSAAFAQQQATGEPVYAILGRLRPAVDQSFDTYLLTNNQQLVGLVGRTPEIESQIVAYRIEGSDFQVKVWGTYYAQGRTSNMPEIVVDAITPTTVDTPPLTGTLTPIMTPVAPGIPIPVTPILVTPAPTPTLVPGTGGTPYIVVTFQSVFLRAGPGTHYPTIGSLDLGGLCAIIGRNTAANWWQIRCPDGQIAWIANDVVNIRGNTAGVPVVEFGPAPTPTTTPLTPTPPPLLDWRASYWANRDLAGQPLVVQTAPAIDFDWGRESPGGGLPADSFSIRFERSAYFPTATYEIEVTVDDGVRVWIDDQLVIDDWRTLSQRTLRVQRLLSGNHNIRVEYFEHDGEALIDFSIAEVRSISDWQVSYYNNPELGDQPVVQRSEPRGQYPIDMVWGTVSPAIGLVTEDQWSARWVGRFYFESGNYQFLANVDDGVRVYIDGIRVLNEWDDGYNEINNLFYGIGAGDHEITVEYYDHTGAASLRVWWYRTGPVGGSRDE